MRGHGRRVNCAAASTVPVRGRRCPRGAIRMQAPCPGPPIVERVSLPNGVDRRPRRPPRPRAIAQGPTIVSARAVRSGTRVQGSAIRRRRSESTGEALVGTTRRPLLAHRRARAVQATPTRCRRPIGQERDLARGMSRPRSATRRHRRAPRPGLQGPPIAATSRKRRAASIARAERLGRSRNPGSTNGGGRAAARSRRSADPISTTARPRRWPSDPRRSRPLWRGHRRRRS